MDRLTYGPYPRYLEAQTPYGTFGIPEGEIMAIGADGVPHFSKPDGEPGTQVPSTVTNPEWIDPAMSNELRQALGAPNPTETAPPPGIERPTTGVVADLTDPAPPPAGETDPPVPFTPPADPAWDQPPDREGGASGSQAPTESDDEGN